MVNKNQKGNQLFRREISPGHCLVFSLFIVLLASLAAGSFNHFNIKCPLINDEAVELLQGTGMPVDKFHFFAPPESYSQGFADIIETFVPYINRVLTSSYFQTDSQEATVSHLRLFPLTAYLAAVLMFALAAWRLWGGFWPLAAGLALGLSSFVLILNHILTRNGISIFWSAAILLLLTWWPGWKKDSGRKENLTAALLLGFLLFMGCWTYTSFRLFTVALFGALLVDWLRYDRRSSTFYMIGDSGVAFLALLVIMITRDDGTLSYFLHRGNYALGQNMEYLKLAFLTFFSPLFHASGQNPHFLTEDVHDLFGHSVLSLWLGPFWILGWVSAWVKRNRFLQFIALVYTFGMGVCTLAGPNVKYLFVFFPFTVLLALSGLRFSLEWLRQKTDSPRLTTSIVLCFFGAMTITELRDAFVRFPSDREQLRNKVSESVAELAIEQASKNKGLVYVQPGIGFDIVFWKTKRHQQSGKLSLHASTQSLREQLDRLPPPPDSVLIIDYPPLEIANEQNGWMPPKELEIVNVHTRRSAVPAATPGSATPVSSGAVRAH